MKPDNIVQAQIDAYQKNFIKYGDDPMGTFQNNKATQYFRFERNLNQFDLANNNYSILDIGAGICDLHLHLMENNIQHQYFGIEIVPEMIAYAQSKFPEIQMSNQNILIDDTVPICDVVVLSGVLNLPAGVTESDWNEFSFSLIKKMFELCRVGISFNMLSSHRTFTDPSLAYFDPAEVFNFCVNNLSRFVHLDHAYPLYEFSITVFKKEYMQDAYDNEDFKKYFKA